MFAVLGIANNALYLGLGYTGLKSVSAGLGGLIVSANPVFTAVLAAIFLGEALTWRKISGLLLGIAGVGFIVWHRMCVGTDSLHGILFTLASLASIVTGTILFKLFAPKGSLWIGNGIQNLAAGIVLLPVALAFADVNDIVPSARLFGAFAFLVLGGSILAYLLVVSSVEGMRGDRREQLSLPDAAARHAVRLDGARRTRGVEGSARDRSGRARHLPGDACAHAERTFFIVTARPPHADGGTWLLRQSATSPARVDTVGCTVDGLSLGTLASNSLCVGWIDGTTATASEAASPSPARAAPRLTTIINAQMT